MNEQRFDKERGYGENGEVRNPEFSSHFFKYIVIALLSSWLVVFAFVPNLMVFVTSFLSRDGENLIRLKFTFENYIQLLDALYLKVFINSALYALITTLICMLLSFPFAYMLSRLKPFKKNLILLLVIIPFWTSALIRTYAVKTLLTTRGVINAALLKLGVIHAPLDMLYTPVAGIAGLVYTLLPFMILPLYAAMEKLDKRLIEASYDLGAGRVDTLMRVVFPLALPGLIAGGLLVFLPALGLFYIPDILGGGKDLMIGNLVKNQFLDARNWPFGAAVSVGLTLIMAALLIVNYRTVKNAGEKGIL